MIKEETQKKEEQKIERNEDKKINSLVGWGCRIHRLHLCNGVKSPQ